MAPFNQAISNFAYNRTEGLDVDVYSGEVDKEWIVGSVPHGGYVLAMMLQICTQRQAKLESRLKTTHHPDLIHVTAHFFGPSRVASFEVHIKTLKTRRMMTNLQADFVQDHKTIISAHVIYGTLAYPIKPSRKRIPIHRHPATAADDQCHPAIRFGQSVWMKPDHHDQPHPEASDAGNSSEPQLGSQRHRPSSGSHEEEETAMWCGFPRHQDQQNQDSLGNIITPPALLFFADMNQRMDWVTRWYPTIILSVDFRCRIPSKSTKGDRPNFFDAFSKHLIGIYTKYQYAPVNAPWGKHDIHTELWTAPSMESMEGESDDWRDKQVCLAVARQMAMTVPMSTNLANKGRGRAML
ncbi:hypothetical protein D9758_000940 [Tetrapyrgos nigripes]|uniref:Acyl-CoA thioesterase-like N-terminal HotDog domain-containing protein n=1 Tax=Tetrapyrgos nigripes TaxID=182062 RepID=A0A8H5GZ58_9AGAR|nr:hypothetical protein D9758_000940 [Tetrapyrgos nigripes]